MESECDKRDSRNDPSHRDSVLQFTKVFLPPLKYDHADHGDTDCHGNQPKRESFFDGDFFQSFVHWHHAFAAGKNPRQRCQRNALPAKQPSKTSDQQSVYVQCRAKDSDLGDRQEISKCREHHQQQPRSKECPLGAEHQKQPERPPAITKRPQVRAVFFASIGMQRDGHLAHRCSVQSTLDDYFGGEFHSRRSQVQTVVQRFFESTHAAVDIVDGNSKHLAD